MRLSVRVEYVAYIYDCLHEAEQSRRLAKGSIRDVYEAQEGMDDESFEDAAEMVGILGRMMRRGLGGGSSGGGSQGAVDLRGSSGGGVGQGDGRERTGGRHRRGQSSVSSAGAGNGGMGHRRGQSSVSSAGGGGRTSEQPTTWV